MVAQGGPPLSESVVAKFFLVAHVGHHSIWHSTAPLRALSQHSSEAVPPSCSHNVTGKAVVNANDHRTAETSCRFQCMWFRLLISQDQLKWNDFQIFCNTWHVVKVGKGRYTFKTGDAWASALYPIFGEVLERA